MARKVFISFLGTTNYVQSIYTLDSFRSTPTRFIQQALIELICKNWTEDDIIYIFCTEKAYKKNWGDNGHEDKYIKEECERIGLGTILKNWKADVHNPLMPHLPDDPIYIPEGFSKKEIWDIFEIVYGKLKEGDQIYFDITHAFRSIPLLGTTLFDYARYMKKVEFVSVHYGAFEKLGTAPQVREKYPRVEERLAPIVDMTEIINLQKCTEMANGLTSYGRLNVLSDELKKDPDFEFIGKSVQTLDEALTGNIGDDIRNSVIKTVLASSKKKINDSLLPKPTKDMLNEVLSLLSDFKPRGNIENYLAAARWSIRYKMLPQAYACGKEYINRLAFLKLEAWNPFPDENQKEAKKKYLEMINAILSIRDGEKYKEPLLTYKKLSDNIRSLPWVIELRKEYVLFNDYRNAVAHIKQGYKYSKLYDYFLAHFENCVKIVEDAPFVQIEQDESIVNGNIFINLTNHPSISWSKEQLTTAQTYGRIIDLPFPIIDETMDEMGINSLTDDYLDKIKKLSGDVPCTVHIMGEMNFTYVLVNKLKAEGYTCVASTSKRDVELLPDGSKQVRFMFCRFRNY